MVPIGTSRKDIHKFVAAINFPQLSSPLVVACHDAGAANLIFAWLHAAADASPKDARNWHLILSGPALHIWQKHPVAGVRVGTDMDVAFLGAQSLLSGTGWNSDLEHQARKLARMRSIRSIAVLDHWVNYLERFKRNGELVLPDAIYVTDQYALLQATRIFRNIPVSVFENTYLKKQLSEIRQFSANATEALYLLEPIRADWPKHQDGEFEALQYFVENLDRLKIPANTTLRIRPHPTDPPGKYNEWVASQNCENIVVDDGPLSLALASAFWVAGCETYAMTIALAAGKKVISTLPPWAPCCNLPHDGIIHLREL